VDSPKVVLYARTAPHRNVANTAAPPATLANGAYATCAISVPRLPRGNALGGERNRVLANEGVCAFRDGGR
jgi:hypothetical protein